jgi:hypothetical protein
MASCAELLTAEEVRNLIAMAIARRTQRSALYWRRKVGRVLRLPLRSGRPYNWFVDPSGDDDDLAMIEKAITIVRAGHPYIA